jgi:hypothetical protein
VRARQKAEKKGDHVEQQESLQHLMGARLPPACHPNVLDHTPYWRSSIVCAGAGAGGHPVSGPAVTCMRRDG